MRSGSCRRERARRSDLSDDRRRGRLLRRAHCGAAIAGVNGHVDRTFQDDRRQGRLLRRAHLRPVLAATRRHEVPAPAPRYAIAGWNGSVRQYAEIRPGISGKSGRLYVAINHLVHSHHKHHSNRAQNALSEWNKITSPGYLVASSSTTDCLNEASRTREHAPINTAPDNGKWFAGFGSAFPRGIPHAASLEGLRAATRLNPERHGGRQRCRAGPRNLNTRCQPNLNEPLRAKNLNTRCTRCRNTD